MFIAALLKNWRLILDVLLIVAVVVLVFLWNPLNIFGGGLKLRDTASLVSEIKEIGELITAEYYGEVISSHDEAKLKIIQTDSIEKLGEDYYYEIKTTLLEVYERRVEQIEGAGYRKRKKKRVYKNLRSDVLDSTNHELRNKINAGNQAMNIDIYYALIYYLGKYENGVDVKVKKFANSDRVKRKTKDAVLSSEYDKLMRYINGDIAYENYLTQGFQSPQSYTDAFYAYKDRGESRKERRIRLAVIGRGSVKAGFKFDKLDEQNFVYDDGNQIIHFFGFRAEILNKDINPWFIPERRVPGFQILTEKNAKFADMKEIKIHCVDKLENYAKEAGIVEQAQKNGEEALKEFFSLVTGDDIKQVIFHKDDLIYQSEEILKDSLITYNELFLIDSLYQKNLNAIREEKNSAIKAKREKLLKKFLADLQLEEIEYKTNGYKSKFNFNFYNRHVPYLLTDSIITSKELEFIEGLRHDVASNQPGNYEYQKMPDEYKYWYEDSLNFINSYNSFLELVFNSDRFYGYYDYKESTFGIDPKKRGDEENKSIAWKKASIMNITYEIFGDSIRHSWLENYSPDTDDLKYLVGSNTNLSEYINVDSLLHWYIPYADGESTKISHLNFSFPGDTTLLSSMTLDNRLFIGKTEHVFNYDSVNKSVLIDSNTFDISSAQNNYQIGSNSSTIFHKSILFIEDSLLSKQEKEVVVIRKMLIQGNQNHNDIGPIMKARRWVDRQLSNRTGGSGGVDSIRTKISQWALETRERFN